MKTKLMMLAVLLPGLAQAAPPGTVTECTVTNDAKSTIQIQWQDYAGDAGALRWRSKQNALLSVSVPGLTVENEPVVFEHYSGNTRCGYKGSTTANLAQGSWIIFGNSPDGCGNLGPNISYAYFMVKNTAYGDAKLPIECHSQIQERQ